MASEDQDILAKISQLAGQINRHKNSQPSNPQTPYIPSAKAHGYSNYAQPGAAWRPSRGGYATRGYRGARPGPVHRNRTLVMNGNGTTTTSEYAAAPQDSESANPKAGAAWVTKKDRHLQLINTNIYEKDSQNRAKAMEETRKQKLMQRDAREKTKFNKHLQRLAGNNYPTLQSHATTAPSNYEINVQGIQFRVAKHGSKLVKVPGDLNAAKSTPKTALVGGVRFYRSKNGNLYRSGIIKAHRRSGVVKKINEPCKAFTTTGSCSKGPKCRYIHDPSKVAACKEFLSKGSCPSGESCDLSHDLTPERTPACLHFAKGNCSNSTCRYTHVRVSPTALVCRAFGIYGYCEKGSSCEDRHVHECPDFSNTGTCTTKGCKLPHRHKASVMRTNTNRGDISPEDESSDLSSDEDEEIDDDDINSDDLDEEYFGEGGKPDAESMQQDYVQLSS
ncbi:Zinc finger CCCH domain-containing protein [Lachnellula suecica]|uniref:Zinc finger CCCH domain-containing protein n=1 Tax=Lachnellula suecica TaxID=602035 RepID=A0A8T9CJR9_9HELO|nr:Zinc finger CCCH domain-containing protein [Lachnellula suecica]